MKSALLKDSIKEIKNTYKRFLSILVMAFLGVGFFAGMRAASPDMVDTIDQYYKESQVYDIKILSTLGLTNDDIDAISEIDEIENTVGTYETEGKIEIDNKEIITKIMSVEKLNKPILLQGNLPKAQNECVVEDSFLTANHKSIGDTIETSAKPFRYEGIPTFAPEHFARIKPVDTMKRKQFLKGITQLAQEGAIQIFKDNAYAAEEIIVGVVGVLQFEVLEHRLKTEYNVEISSQQLNFRFIRWLPEDTETEQLKLSSSTKIAKDLKDRPVVLFENDWSMRWAEENNKGLVLSDISER